MPTVLVAIAGAVGAVVRYRIGLAVGVRSFPWATLGINLSGSFALAVVLAGPVQARWGAAASTAVAVGLLGSYTTFSTFGYETFTLLRIGRVAPALAYASASFAGGLAATAAGYAVGRSLTWFR